MILQSMLLLSMVGGLGACDPTQEGLTDKERSAYKVGTEPDTISQAELQKRREAPKMARKLDDSSDPAQPNDPPKQATRINPRRLFQLNELDTMTLKINKTTFKSWIMDDDEKRAEGMMFLEDQDFTDKDTMIFVYDSPFVMNFWMRNTLVDLDIAYVGSNKRIVSQTTMKALDESLVSSKKPAQYAIEFKKGALKKFGIQVGDLVEFSKPIKSKN